MHLRTTRLAVRAGVLTAIFVVAFSGVLIALHEAAPPAPTSQSPDVPNPRVHRNMPPAVSSHSNPTRAHVNAAKAKAKNLPPEQHDQVRKQLRPAIVTVRSPVAVELGQPGMIRLKIENDPAPGNKTPALSLGDLIDPVRTAVDGNQNVKIYQMQVSERLTTQLFEVAAEHEIPRHGADTVGVPAEGVTLMWNVPASPLGAKALEVVMSGHVDAVPDPYPLGTLALEMPVVVSGLAWVKYQLGEIGTWWNWLAGFAASLVAVAGAIPLVKKWFPLPHGRKDPEPQKVT
jgi:hypothetical protein